MLDHLTSDLEAYGARQRQREARQSLEGGSSLLATHGVLGVRRSPASSYAHAQKQPGQNAMRTPGRPPGLPPCLRSPHKYLLLLVSTALLDCSFRILALSRESSCLLGLSVCFWHEKISGAWAVVIRGELERILMASVWLGVSQANPSLTTDASCVYSSGIQECSH